MKKIMFNDALGLTEAVLDGRKTMTRRFVPKGYDLTFTQSNLDFIRYYSNYQIGDTLAVAQKYEDIRHGLSDREASWFLDTLHLRYNDKCAMDIPAWRNKEFVMADLMPHRIRITNVRVERLHDISNEECLREGVYHEPIELEDHDGLTYYASGYTFNGSKICYNSPRDAFAALIDKVSGKGTWDKNPWVFVYEFKLVK